MRSRRVLLIVLGLGAAGPLTACDEDPSQQQVAAQTAPAVSVVHAKRQQVSEQVEFVGRVRAIDRVEVRARIEGVLQERAFREGDLVQAGQLLFRIEPDTFEAQVKTAEANLARAEARKVEADKTLARGKTLLQRGNISVAKVDEAEAGAESAAAEVLVREAELRQARINLSYTEIHSAISGRASEAAYSTGNLVNPQSGVLAVVTSMDPVYVTFSLSERILLQEQRDFAERGGVGDIRDQDAQNLLPRLRLQTGDMYEFQGLFDFLGAEVDPLTGSVPVRLEFPNPDGMLLHGQFVTVVLQRERTESRIVLPQSAVQEDQAGAFVLVIDRQNLAQIRRVELGGVQGTGRIVEQGLEEGEVVLVEGIQKVRPGVAVEPVFRDGAAKG